MINNNKMYLDTFSKYLQTNKTKLKIKKKKIN